MNRTHNSCNQNQNIVHILHFLHAAKDQMERPDEGMNDMKDSLFSTHVFLILLSAFEEIPVEKGKSFISFIPSSQPGVIFGPPTLAGLSSRVRPTALAIMTKGTRAS